MTTTSTLPEIIELFSKLALDLQTQTHNSPFNQSQEQEVNDSSTDPSISKLTLSLTHNSRVRVLDTALSLMCFKAPQVLDSVIEYSVKTIVSVLSSSISCEVFRFHNEEVLQIGSFISRSHCVELIVFVFDVILKLEHGMRIDLLLSAVIRVAASASCYKYISPSMCVLNGKPIDGSITAISKLLGHLSMFFSFNDHDIPTRLLFWYLDPLSLKHDISKILQETIKRPFLCLSVEFYERMDWRSILICLVFSPVMFIDTRALLHGWFLQTGLSSILELLMELVSVLLDVISRPTWWGLSIELGSKLPFSNAYFPYKSDFFRTLTGPLSYESFLQLVHRIRKSASLYRELCDPTIKPSAVRVASIDHKSIWALAISFPDWFYFASVLLFSDNKNFQENFQVKCPLWVPKFGQLPAAAAAATFIAWILSPVNKHNQDALFDNLTKLSERWILKESCSDNSQNGMIGYKKKVKKPKFCDSKENSTLGNKYDSQVIILWLNQFQNIMKHNESIDKSACCEAKSYAVHQQHDRLFRRIPLGILIGSSGYMNEDGYELLLHYAATSRILSSHGTENTSLNHVNQNSSRPEQLIGGINKKEAVSGACLVFSLIDVVEKMSVSLFETEESRVGFICMVKLRAGRYLIKCIKSLIQFNVDEDGVPMLLDLQGRLERWRHQGKEVSELQKDLDEALKGLSHELSL